MLNAYSTQKNILQFGPHVSFALANTEDYKRYDIKYPGHVQWAEQWIKERLSFNGNIGVLAHTEKDFVFRAYKPISQPHFFYNLISNRTFFSDFYIKYREVPLKDLHLIKDSFSDICCPMQLQSLKEEELTFFLDFASTALKKDGNLFLSYGIFLNCSGESIKILKSAPPLKKRNKQVERSFWLPDLGQENSLFALRSTENILIWQLNKQTIEAVILNDSRVVLQNFQKIIQRQHNKSEQKYFNLIDDIYLVAVALWLKKFH